MPPPTLLLRSTGYPFTRSPDYFTAVNDVTQSATAASDFFTCATLAPTTAAEDAEEQREYAVLGSLQPFQCPTCRRVYSSEKGLSRHFRHMHGPRVWHVCEYCGKASGFNCNTAFVFWAAFN